MPKEPSVVFVPVASAHLIRVPDDVHMPADWEPERLTRILPDQPPIEVLKVPASWVVDSTPGEFRPSA